MKGYDIYKKASLRAGITEKDILSDSFTFKSAEYINQIANDLKIKGLNSLSENIECSPEKAEALCCGVAMLICLDIEDGSKAKVLTDIYNAKRASVLSGVSTVKDILPKPDGGYSGEI